MARIRTIKPEFWTSDQVVSVSPLARLLFIGLWNFADDQGVHPASPLRIKLQIFPGDNIKEEKIKELLKELLSNNLLTIYEAEGKPFFFITGWHHQKIAKKTAKHPPPQVPVQEQCATSTVPVQEQYCTSTVPVQYRSPPDVYVDVDVDVDVEKKGAVVSQKKGLAIDLAELPIPQHLKTGKFKKWLKQWIDWKQSSKHAWKHQNGPTMFLNRLAEYSEAEAIEAIQRALEAGHATVYPRSNGFKSENQKRPGFIATDKTTEAELSRSRLYEKTLGPIRKQISQAQTPEEKEELQEKLKTAREKLEQKLAAQGVA